VEVHPHSALEVEAFDSVSQRDAVLGLGCGESHPNDRTEIRLN
jgi:hypothetical protein